MTGFTIHPFETSICLWALIFSLLVCLIMGLMKKVLLRNCILFFFWFMLNAVFQILEITALGREDVLVYRSLIQIIYIVNTAVIVLALGAGIRHGISNIFRFTKEEWIYTGVNALSLFAVMSSVFIIGSGMIQKTEGVSVLPWAALGLIAAAAAAAANLTVFARLHRRLRRSSPHMLYIFCTAVFFACMVFALVFGAQYAGTVFTVMMMLFLVMYMLGRLYRKDAADLQPEVLKTDAGKELTEKTAAADNTEPRVIREYVKVDEAAFLAQNPHFICNTLNTVCYQIDHNPGSAKKAVSTLGDYMQGKYNGLKTDHMIPFESEIKTLNSYLSLQKLRYEDQLNVVTDYKANGFFLPALSLVTVVEHVMKNIILHSAEKGTLRIETVRNADACVIRVICDDEINDAESLAHICEAFPLLKTVKERLAYFCEGSLEAVRRDSKTEIIITVPHLDEAETDSDVTASAAPDPV